MSKFKIGQIPHNTLRNNLDDAIEELDRVITHNINTYGVLVSDSILHIIEPSLYKSFGNNAKKWGKYRPANHIKVNYSENQTHGFFPHPKLIRLQKEFNELSKKHNSNLIFKDRVNVEGEMKNFLKRNNISSKLYKDFVSMIDGHIMSENIKRKQSLLETRKLEMKEWLNSNHGNVDRLSYNTIKRYLDDNGLSELSKSWGYIWQNLKQEGLVTWFNEIGLTFWIQDNKKDFDLILKNLLTIAKTFYKNNGCVPSWNQLIANGFDEYNYVTRDKYGLYWTLEDLNGFYEKNGLPKIPSKSDKTIDDVMSMNLDEVLTEIFKTFNNIPPLATVLESDLFYDFYRYLVKVNNDTGLSKNKTYNNLWLKKFGPDYVKLTNLLISIDGHRCDSKHELVLLNYRHLNGLSNNPHMRYSDIFPEDVNYICDNYVENKFITEIAGYDPTIKKHKHYWDKIDEKRKICDKYGVSFLLIEGYKFIGTKTHEFIEYIHEIYSNLYDGMKKPDYFDVIKSQTTEIYVEEIVNFFKKSKTLTGKTIENGLSNKSYRFYTNNIGGMYKFIKQYNDGVFNKFKSTKKVKIDFNDKTYSKRFSYKLKNENIIN